ncbi:MAG TPA: glycosyltransferase [Thermoanaerobaculaceae bacterium]|nr:glycosyltransferase [Thermoanaerobaculaceae bacterium]
MQRTAARDQERLSREPTGEGPSGARVLILHASVGSGHEHAARALAAAFAQLPNCEARVEDALAFAAPVFRRAYRRSYLDTVARAPILWQRYFEATDLSDPDRIASDSEMRGQLEKPLLARLDRVVNHFGPSAIVCTHFLPAEVLVQRRPTGRAHPPLYTVVTDHVAHSFWQTPGIDGYFVASEIPRDQLLARGVPPAAVRISGIPVGIEIATAKDPRELRAHRGWPVDRPLISLFGGGLSRAHVRRVAEDLRALGQPLTLVIVSGRNAELPAALADLDDGPQVRVLVLDAIDYVDDLVAASDLVVTKSGGLIVSEIIARGTPMLVIAPIPGQEEWNADYVVSAGAGIQLRRPELVAEAVRRLLAEPSRLAAMRARARQVGRPRAALDIAECVLRDLESRFGASGRSPAGHSEVQLARLAESRFEGALP